MKWFILNTFIAFSSYAATNLPAVIPPSQQMANIETCQLSMEPVYNGINTLRLVQTLDRIRSEKLKENKKRHRTLTQDELKALKKWGPQNSRSDFHFGVSNFRIFLTASSSHTTMLKDQPVLLNLFTFEGRVEDNINARVELTESILDEGNSEIQATLKFVNNNGDPILAVPLGYVGFGTMGLLKDEGEEFAGTRYEFSSSQVGYIHSPEEGKRKSSTWQYHGAASFGFSILVSPDRTQVAMALSGHARRRL